MVSDAMEICFVIIHHVLIDPSASVSSDLKALYKSVIIIIIIIIITRSFSATVNITL